MTSKLDQIVTLLMKLYLPYLRQKQIRHEILRLIKEIREAQVPMDSGS